jgi:hypothetical protein
MLTPRPPLPVSSGGGRTKFGMSGPSANFAGHQGVEVIADRRYGEHRRQPRPVAVAFSALLVEAMRFVEGVAVSGGYNPSTCARSASPSCAVAGSRDRSDSRLSQGRGSPPGVPEEVAVYRGLCRIHVSHPRINFARNTA